jgi:hypothetical protein
VRPSVNWFFGEVGGSFARVHGDNIYRFCPLTLLNQRAKLYAAGGRNRRLVDLVGRIVEPRLVEIGRAARLGDVASPVAEPIEREVQLSDGQWDKK